MRRRNTVPITAISLPKMMDTGVMAVPTRESNVCRSLSPEILPAVKPGTIKSSMQHSRVLIIVYSCRIME